MINEIIVPNIPFSPIWQNTPMATTHKKEFAIGCILNSQLCNYGMRSRRVLGDPYSLYDLEVMEYNFTTLNYGNLVCRIDLESKPDIFPKSGIPKRWVRGVSFLQRKTKKEINYSRDVYLLHDSRPNYPRVIWAPYKTIRDYGEVDNRGFKNEFLVVKEKDYNLLYFSIHDLVNWCNRLKNQEVTR